MDIEIINRFGIIIGNKGSVSINLTYDKVLYLIAMND